jgi:hypothetical protein
MRYSKLLLLLLLILTFAFTLSGYAANNGTDNASQSAYSSSWSTGANGSAGGDAFLPWTLATTGTGFEGFFIGNSTNLNSGSGANINVNGDSWGMYANTDPTTPGSATAVRMFTSDGTGIGSLGAGQTFSINIAVNFNNGGDKGIDLLDSTGDFLFDLNIGEDAYVVNNATTGTGDLPNQNYSANTAFALTFTQTSLTSGTWSVARSGGQTDLAGGTYTGDAAGVKLYVNNTSTNGPQDDLYANSMSITSAVPEPSTVGLLACGTGVLILWKRSRRRVV